MEIGQNWPKIESFPRTEFRTKELQKYSKWQKKITIFRENFVISGSFEKTKTSKWTKKRPKIGRALMNTKGLSNENNRTIENNFFTKICLI